VEEVAMSISSIIWVHVPPAVQLEVTVSPADAAFTSGGDIIMHEKGVLPVKQWSDTQLRPGPAVERLKDGSDYTVEMRIVPSSTATVNGSITAVLRDANTSEVLENDDDPFTITQGMHHTLKILIDADPVVPRGPVGPVGALAPRAAGARRGARAGRSRGKKRGK
jgi:hypothetical protein